jgi:phosphatidylinositol alpha-mannosyltransferase
MSIASLNMPATGAIPSCNVFAGGKVGRTIDGDAVVIPNGVDVSSFRNAKPMFGWPGRNLSIVFLGRGDEPRKGLAVLVEAYPEIRKKFPEIRLLIAGPGEPDNTLKSLSREDRASVTVAVEP